LNLTVIIPLYNEADVITKTLDRLRETTMPGFVKSMEVIIVDDCSTDDSVKLIGNYETAGLKTKLIRLTVNSGKGTAVAAGVRASTGDTIVIQDADLELDPADIPALLEKMHSEDLDIVSGTRFRTGQKYRGHARPATIANRTFSFFASLITGRKITDITCGYKAVRKSLYERLCLQEKRFGFETELMIRSLRDKSTAYGECDVRYLPRRKTEGKKIRISDGIGIISKTLMYGLEGKRWLSAMTVALIITFMTVNMLNVKHWKEEQRVIEWDAISYYAYLPATLIYNDLSLSFIDGYDGPHRFVFWPEKGPDGKYLIKTTMGLSVMWLPFFIAGNFTALITGADAGGYSEPYKFFLLISALFYLLTGLIYLRRILITHFSDKVVSLVLAGFAFGTNLYWYTLFQGTMAHVYSFALMSVFVWYSMDWYRTKKLEVSPPKSEPAPGRHKAERGGVASQSEAGVVCQSTGTGHSVWHIIRLGLLLGLISLIRPTNIIIIIFFVFYGVISGKDLRNRIRELAAGYKYILLMLLMVILVWVPQMIYWKEMTGHWLYFSYGSDERFFFGDPAIIKGLFSYRKGLFIYTPLLLFAFAGIILLWMKRSPHALPVTLFVPLNIYIIFSWWCWWYGGGFGQRAFIDSYALMAVSAAALLGYAFSSGRKWLRNGIITAYLVLMSLGIFNNIQYYHGAIHWDSMTKAAYWDSFGRVRPSARFNNLLEAPDYDSAREGKDR
jgi:glycosyltransferase involved in cell wall biosynthesis